MLRTNSRTRVGKNGCSGSWFSICKMLVNEQLRYMPQLVDKVIQIERLKFKKECNWKFDKSVRRDRVAYIETSNFTNELDSNKRFWC